MQNINKTLVSSWKIMLIEKYKNLIVCKSFFLVAESWSFSSTIEPASSYLMPYFDFDVHRNITVTIGQTAFLHCRVERLGDKDVSLPNFVCAIKHFDSHCYLVLPIEFLLNVATNYSELRTCKFTISQFN